MHLEKNTQDRLVQELVRDRAKSFDDEFRRTTNLERTILDEYGRDGALFLMQRKGFQSPEGGDCPWRIDGLEAAEAVRTVLGPLRRDLRKFFAELQGRVRWVIPARKNDKWSLAYFVDRALHDGRRYYEIVFGGPPNPSPQLSARAQSVGWCVPRSLQRLCEVHDGFGTLEVIRCNRIDAAAELKDLGELMDEIAAAQNFQPVNYAFQDLLEFFPDGSGNCQAFHRHRRDEPDPPTVDWDHETREIAAERPFFKFLDDAYLRSILDEE